MIQFWCFLACAAGCAVYAALPFLGLKAPAHFAIGLTLAVATNIAWIWLSRIVSGNKLVLYTALWDSMVTVVFVLVALGMTSRAMTAVEWTGLGLLCSGMLVLKFA